MTSDGLAIEQACSAQRMQGLAVYRNAERARLCPERWPRMDVALSEVIRLNFRPVPQRHRPPDLRATATKGGRG